MFKFNFLFFSFFLVFTFLILSPLILAMPVVIISPPSYNYSFNTTDHSLLSNLDYASAGHTGFQSTITNLDVNKGGTSKTSWTPYTIPFLSGATTFSEILIGSSGKCLKVNSSGDGYIWGSCGSGGGGIEEEVDPYWSDNFSLYNATWSEDTNTEYTAGSNLSLDGAEFSVNTTGLKEWFDSIYVTVTTLLDYVQINDLISLVGNWTADKPDYYNSTEVDTALQGQDECSEISGCVENALTEETDPLAYNGTLAYNSSLVDYYLKSNPYTFWNSTFATFNKTYADTLYYGITNPFGFFNSTNPSPTYNSTYATWAYNQTTPAINTAWANAVNGTLMSQSTFNTNYTTNDPVYRSFANNYSTFLTHITWANAVNGTLLLSTGGTLTGNLNISNTNNITSINCIIFTTGGKICGV